MKLFKLNHKNITIWSILSMILLLITPILVYASSIVTGSIGTGQNINGAGSGRYNFCTAPAYAVFLSDDNWMVDPVKNERGQVVVRQTVMNYLSYKYPNWAPEMEYVYVAPQFDTTGGQSGSPDELTNYCPYAAETNRSYSGWTLNYNPNIYRPATYVGSETPYSSDGRQQLFDALKAGNGYISRDTWTQIGRDYTTQYYDQILSFIFSDGPSSVSDKMRQYTYADYTDWNGAQYGLTDDDAKNYWQRAAYANLCIAFYENISADNNYGAWQTQIDKILCDVRNKDNVNVFPLLVVDRAFGYYGFGGQGGLVDAVDYYQYSMGMTGGKWKNLRENEWWDAITDTGNLFSISNAICGYLDSQDSGRSKPITGGIECSTNLGSVGNNSYLIGIRSYDTNRSGFDFANNCLSTLSTMNCYGYNVGYCAATPKQAVTQPRQDIYTDEPKKVTLSKGETMIGEDIPVHLEMNQENCNSVSVSAETSGSKFTKSLTDLAKVFDDNNIQPTYELYVGMRRDKSVNDSIVESGDSPFRESTDGDIKLKTVDEMFGFDTGSLIGKEPSYSTNNIDTIKSVLTGVAGWDFLDETANDPIQAGQTVKYEYYSYVILKIKLPDGTYWENDIDNGTKSPIQPTNGEAPRTSYGGNIVFLEDDGYDYKEFTVNDNMYHYDSWPVAYSEMKENEPMAEEWEAMAGTVTTKPLYFASGGSEFAVTIDCTPMQGYFTRNYKVYFDGWKDQHYGTYGPCGCCGAHPPHDICPGKICHCSAGGQSFTWSQKINYSYMRINTAKVWRVKTSAVTGMKELTPMNADENGDIVAQICKGDEEGEELYASIFTDTSTEESGSDKTGSANGGRFHWTEQPDTLNPVYHVTNSAESSAPWGKGQAEGGGACGNHYSINPQERADYESLKNNRKNEVYVQSDYLIIHTKEGDMVVNYSETHGESSNLCDDINATMDTKEMWWANDLCPSNWRTTEINQFWYNGNYSSPETCFQPKISPYTFKSSMFTPMDMHWYESKTDVDREAYDAGWLTKQVEHEIPKPTSDDFNEYPMNVRWTEANAPGATESHHENHKVESETCDNYDCRGEMELWRQFNPLLNYKNGIYDVGNSSILYERILSYADPTSGEIKSPLDKGWTTSNPVSYANRYEIELTKDDEAKYLYEDGKSYLIVHSAYNDNDVNCNDIVIHNPVSAEYSYVLSLPEGRDQRTDKSKTLSAGAISSMTDAQDNEYRTANPDYHNNLIFNGFVEEEKKDGDTLGWASGIDTALGWYTSVINKEEGSAYEFGCDVDRGIQITNNGHCKPMYYQYIDAVPGHNYTLDYNIVENTGNPAKVQIQYLDALNNIVSKTSQSLAALRVVIYQDEVGSTLVNNIVVKDMSRDGFTPNYRKVYDNKLITTTEEDDAQEATPSDITSTFRYSYKNVNDGTIVHAMFAYTDSLEDCIQGRYLVTDGRHEVNPDDDYIFVGYSYYYICNAKDELEAGLIRITSEYRGEEIQDDGILHTVIGKMYRYTGRPEVFIAPEDGDYLFEMYGADGGDYVGEPYSIPDGSTTEEDNAEHDHDHNGTDEDTPTDANQIEGGHGAYVAKVVHLRADDVLVLNVGGRGKNNTTNPSEIKEMIEDGTIEPEHLILEGGYGGGGSSIASACSGGGASSIYSFDRDELRIENRLVVAGGGAGASSSADDDSTDRDAKDVSSYDSSNTLGYGDDTFGSDALTVNSQSIYLGAGGGGYYGGKAQTETDSAQGGDSYADSRFVDNTYAVQKLNPTYDGNGAIKVTYLKHTNLKKDSSRVTGTQTVQRLASRQYNNNPPAEAFITVREQHRDEESPIVNIDNGNSKLDTFINIDYGFSIYFPNEGDFGQEPDLHGIAECTPIKGLGYHNNMDTTEWTYAKYVQFPFRVIHKGVRYEAKEKIYLDVNKEYFDFYCVLGNQEAAAAKVRMVALAINNQDVKLDGDSQLPDLYKTSRILPGGTDNPKAIAHPDGDIYATPMDNATDKLYILDGECRRGDDGHYKDVHAGEALFHSKATFVGSDPYLNRVPQKDEDCYSYKQFENSEATLENEINNNYRRYEDEELAARHSAIEIDQIDVVGRIGNYVIDDVGDPRFANFFKKTDGTGNFILPGLVPTVDQSKQNFFVGDMFDIRGMDTAALNGRTNRGESDDSLHSDSRTEPYRSEWMNLQQEPKRPGSNHKGDLGNDEYQQTAYNHQEVLGDVKTEYDNYKITASYMDRNPNPNNAFLSTYDMLDKFSGDNEGIHENEFGQLAFKADEGLTRSFPMTSDMNNIEALRGQHLRLGYPVFQDIQTIGSYQAGTVQVTPTYYVMDTKSDPDNPTITPVDIYMAVDGSYQPINIYGASQVETKAGIDQMGNVVPGGMTTTVTNDPSLDGERMGLEDVYGNEIKYHYIYDNKQFIDWDNENIRRNSRIGELELASQDEFPEYAPVSWNVNGARVFDDDTISLEWKNSKYIQDNTNFQLPYGMYYATGNNQVLNLNQRCRTFAGESSTYGTEINRVFNGNRNSYGDVVTSDYDDLSFKAGCQRWHFTNNLPSSAVAVKAGSVCNTLSIRELRQPDYVILTAMDIKAIGAVWTLQADAGTNNDDTKLKLNDKVRIDGKNYDISSIDKGKVITVTAIDKSAKDDKTITGTH